MVERVVQLPLGDHPPEARLVYGVDVRESLRAMPEGSVHCVVTSPPYWGLRSYLHTSDPNKASEIGSEEALDDYIANLVEVFREVRRVLRKDGVVWINLGDSFLGGGRAGKNPEMWTGHASYGKADPVVRAGGFGLPSPIPEGLKAKDLALVPFRAALALQADGWWVRSVIPWIKQNAQPESVTDRPTTAHEYWILLTKSGSYYYDIDAVRKPHSHLQRRYTPSTAEHKAGASAADVSGGRSRVRTGKALAYAYASDEPAPGGNPGGRNRRTSDAWVESIDEVISDTEGYLAHLKEARESGLLTSEDGEPLGIRSSTVPYKGAHFAVFSPRLIEPLILSSTSERGCCPSCGAPWRRGPRGDQEGAATSWEPDCSCASNDGSARAVVLDPFSGSATTGMVAMRHGRNYVGLDLNESYFPLAEARVLEGPPPNMDAGETSGGSALDLFGGSDP